jgi:rod shape-determining protein MreD
MISNIRIGWVVLGLLLLSIIPMGFPFMLFRPAWILLLVIYLQCTAPKQCSVMFILLLGLFLDALSLGVLGQHAFVLLLTAFAVSKRAQRFRLFSMSQQLIGIVAFSAVYQLVLLGTQLIWGYPVMIWGAVGSVMMSVLCWPWFQYLGDSLFFSPVR